MSCRLLKKVVAYKLNFRYPLNVILFGSHPIVQRLFIIIIIFYLFVV